MKIFFFILLIFFTQSISSFSQGINNLWLMGYDSWNGQPYGGTNIDFFSGTPVINYVSRPMNLGTSNALISDINGNLLFYTNGIYIANAANDTMMNGGGLNPSAYTTQCQIDGLSISQSDIVIPFPNDSTKYYLFHLTVDSLTISNFIYYTVIDMSLAGGLGGVVSKNNVLIHETLNQGGLTACKHANGRDWWLIAHENSHYHDNNVYLKFLITPEGISGPFRQSIGKLRVDGVGESVFSPDGKVFANYDAIDKLDIMDFDRCTGNFSNLIHVGMNDTAFISGVAFSKSSKTLYVSATKYIYQFDMTASDIPSTMATVAVWDNFYSPGFPFAATFGFPELAPDGKIYIATGNGTDYMHVINYPDSLGLLCNVCQHCVHLPSYNAETIPNYPNYFLGADSLSACDTLRIGIANVIRKQNEILVFPNPARDKVYAVLDQSMKIKSIKMFDAFGREMNVNFSFLKNGEYLEVNTTTLSQGIYFLELLSEKEKIVKRVVKE